MHKTNTNQKYDVIIIGSGPAGMFAAKELIDSNSSLKILIIDKGNGIDERICPQNHHRKTCTYCPTCNIMCGVGGAGTFSDGTLNECVDLVGGNLLEIVDQKTAQVIIDQVSKTFISFGAPNEIYNPYGLGVEELKYKARTCGMRFIDIKQRHIGSDNAPIVINNFYNYLKQKGVEFLLNSEVENLQIVTKNSSTECVGITLANKKQIVAGKILLAPGRSGGSSWIGELAERHSIKKIFGPIDIGVRVEVPYEVAKPLTDVNRDPKIHLTSSTYDDQMRTFCTNLQGFVVKEVYKDYVCTNGHSNHCTKSPNTNFALLTRLQLTEPVGDTAKYGRSIARMATIIGDGKPILQRYGDLKRGRRTDKKKLTNNFVDPTLQDYTAGDLSLALPGRIITNIKEGIEKLDKIIPGVAADQTLLIGVEIKFYSIEISCDEKMQTNIQNLFVAGDITPYSRDIVKASSTGIIAARGILSSF